MKNHLIVMPSVIHVRDYLATQNRQIRNGDTWIIGDTLFRITVAKQDDDMVKGMEFDVIDIHHQIPHELRPSYLTRLRTRPSAGSASTPHAMPNRTTYVLGFAFNIHEISNLRVYLIEKQKPEWQRGSYNGIGGKLEANESTKDAMEREFGEETGVTVPADKWQLFHVMRFGNGAVVHCFATLLPSDVEPRTIETEKVFEGHVDMCGRLHEAIRIIPNLSWLIPMAFDHLIKPIEERMIVAQ